MSKTNYHMQADLLIKVIDIAILCFMNTPPEGWEENQIQHVINVYLDYKNKIVDTDSKFKNLTSLNYKKNEVLTSFQEGSGRTVNSFWNEIYRQKLDIKRVNKFDQVFKRGKIKNLIEYDIIIDLYNSYKETNMLSKLDIDKMNDMISNFEKKKQYI
jgi:hypothetical protein